MVYLGLQDDEPDYGGEYESYPAYGDVDEGHDGDGAGDDYGERPRRDAGYDAEPEPARAAVGTERRSAAPERRGRDEPTAPPTPRPSVVRTIGPTTAARVHIVEPQSFNDAQEVGDRLKANQPVILNLQGLPKELQRRLIDFSSGLAYAVGGQMAKVNDQVFLLKPSDVEVSQEEKERLQARGLYQA
ncbi:MAG TPA: cell division protein SepF [Acidimicrobiia bacterium]|nr:cell division protein SepF [Acidimicrobiia bacterium]